MSTCIEESTSPSMLINARRPGTPSVTPIRIALVAAFLIHLAANRGWISDKINWEDLAFDIPFAVAAIACWRASQTRIATRHAWRAQSIAMALFLAGNLYIRFVLNNTNQVPTLSDAMWLGFYVFTYIAIGLVAKARLKHFHPSSWLDGAIGGLGAAALAAAFVLGPVLVLTKGQFLVVATNLAYPLADLLLIMILVTVGHALGMSDPTWWMLAAGIVLFFIGDLYFLYANAAGTYVPGKSLFELTWTGGVTIIGLAGTRLQPNVVKDSTAGHRYFVPAFFTATSIALLVYGQWHRLPTFAVVITVLALAVATIRLSLTMREVRALAASRSEARTDYLTDLPNRRHLAERLAIEVDAPKPASLVVLDLDRFKEVNDSLGHLAGDRLLREVGRRLTYAAPAQSLLARLGGDEFAVLLPGHDSVQAAAVASDLLDAVRQPFELSGVPIPVQASIGIATSPEHARTAGQILACADIAMYQAKRSGAGVGTFRVEDDNPSLDRLELLSDLRQALDDGQFTLHYQPQIDLRTSQIYGVEALVRWNHPRRGLLQPEQFLPMATETGLMVSLTASVLRHAIADWNQLRSSGLTTRLSVNISAMDLASSATVDAIEAIVDEGTIDAASLVLEVTEGAVLADRSRSTEMLQRLRDLGIRVSVDDYGTGQASLSYLRDLPLDEIKLDRTFLRGVPADTHNAAIVRSTIELAHTLGLPVVAEGIENEATRRWLIDLSCDVGQGFHLGRPMPKQQLLSWTEAYVASL